MKPAGLFTLLALGGLFVRSAVRAQQPRVTLPGASATLSPAANATTASLEERIAAARSVKVMDSILGIKLGSELDEAHEKLDPLSAPGKFPKSEGGAADAKAPAPEAHGAPDATVKPDADEDEGHKVLWQLAGTDYSAIYVTADDKERIDSITGFLRPEKQVPFGEVGEVAKAPVKDNMSVVWDVLRVGQPLFRVVAKGTDGKADTIRMFVVRRKTGELVPYVEGADGKPR